MAELVVPAPKKRQGKKSRKIGRCIKKPSKQRYTNEERWIKNKARRIVKQMKKFPLYKAFNLNDDVSVKVAVMMKK